MSVCTFCINILGNGFTLAISTYFCTIVCQNIFLTNILKAIFLKKIGISLLHSFLSTGLLGNGFTLAVLWRSPRLYNCCTPYLISMTICDLLASLLILPLLGRVHRRFKFQVWHTNQNIERWFSKSVFVWMICQELLHEHL